jgi:CCR4-NOT transcription complex subunit 7/8
MAVIRELVERYPYVAMDTEFPGVVAKPVGDLGSAGFAYQTLQCNVDLLKIIQLGISFCDADGNTPNEGCYCYQFNFRFDLDSDMYAEDSIELLKQSGIDFERHASEGVDVQRFGELIMMSGLVLVDEVKWISFHSGYDFGYLLKILTCSALPSTEEEFFQLLHVYFPRIFDVKLLMMQVDGLHGGLQRVADDTGVERVGPMHQAGSDSMLTNAAFFRVADLAFASAMPEDRYALVDDKYRGEIYGLGAHAYKGKGGGGSAEQPREPSNGHSNGHMSASGSAQSFGASEPDPTDE